MMCAFITVFMTISSFIEMKKVVFNLSEYIEQNIPEFSYEDGQIQMDTEEPIIIDNIQYDGINRIIINPLLESDEEKRKNLKQKMMQQELQYTSLKIKL